MKQVNLPLEVAKKMWVSANECIRDFALANYTKEELEAKELPKSFEELNTIRGFYTNASASTSTATSADASHRDNKNIFATKEQAEASIALAQLSQLMVVYNDGWIPDWSSDSAKYVIVCHNNAITHDYYQRAQKFLAFKTKELRDEFLKNFKDLIEQAKPLL